MTIEGFPPPISLWQLALSTSLVLVPGAISAGLRLGLLRSLVWGATRTVVQLMLIGYVLTWLFDPSHSSPLYFVGVVFFMCTVAAHAAGGRAHNVKRFPTGLAWVALACSTFLVATVVCRIVINPEHIPWHFPMLAVPIAGMLLGNSMNGISLALDRMHSEIRANAGEVEALIAFGATPWEACRGAVREGLRAGMTPIINALMVVGLVSLPGMMTGQILGGASVETAVRYQIVVMLMIAASVAIGCLVLVGLTYRRCFTEDGALMPEFLASHE